MATHVRSRDREGHKQDILRDAPAAVNEYTPTAASHRPAARSATGLTQLHNVPACISRLNAFLFRCSDKAE
jgi:hypothetical protein